jgi:hypothetical protein
MLYRRSRCDRSRRRGVVAVIFAVSLVALLSVVALTADGGQALAERRQLQAAADAAALAGASDLFENWQANAGSDSGGSAVASARAVAKAAGYDNGNNATVNVNVPGGTYQGGPHAGQTIPAGYVEVLIAYNQPAGFSAVFSGSALALGARSVARSQWVWAPPIVVLDPSLSGALYLGAGSNTVTVPNGPVYVNSSSATAMNDISGMVMQAPQYNVVGGASNGFNYYSNPNFPASGYLRTGTHPVADPLQYIPAIDSSTLTTQPIPLALNGVYNLQPGRYAGGLSFGPSDVVNMAQGIYYMDSGGFKFFASGTTPGSLNAPSVMIYSGGAHPGLVWISGTGAVTLGPLPPSYGLAQGITVFQDRTAGSAIVLNHQFTANQWNIRGAFYGARSAVSVNNQGGDPSIGSQFICNNLSLYLGGDMTVPGNYVLTRGLAGVE